MALGVPSVFQGQAQPKYGGGGFDSSQSGSSGLTAPGVPPSRTASFAPPNAQGPNNSINLVPWQQAGTSFGLPFDPTRGQPAGGIGNYGSLTGMPNDQSSLLQAIWSMNARRAQDAMSQYGSNAAASAGFANQRLDLQGQQLDVQKGALDRQNPLLDQLSAARQGQSQSDMDYYGMMKTQSQTDYDQAMKHLDEEFSALGTNTARDTSRQQGAAAAQGATSTLGNSEALGQIQQANTVGQQNIANERSNVTSQRNQGVGLYTKRYNDAAFAAKIDAATSAEDKSKIFDQMKILDLQAQELGVSRAEVAQSLSNALKTSKSSYSDLDQLLGALTSGDPNQLTAAYDWIKKQYPNGITTG